MAADQRERERQPDPRREPAASSLATPATAESPRSPRRPDPAMRQLGREVAPEATSLPPGIVPPPSPSAPVAIQEAEPLLDAALGNLEVGPLLGEVLARLRETLRADTAAVLFQEEGRLRVRRAVGLEAERPGPDTAEGPLATGALVAGQAVLSRAGITPRPPSALVERLGLGTALAVPMRVEGRPVGVVRVGWFTDRPLTPRETTLVQHAADWLGLSLDRARLFERERAERERAERGNAFKTELLAMVGHDLRAPLKVLARHMQWVLDERSSPELRERSLRTVRRTLGRLESVLDDFVQLAQVEADGTTRPLVLHATTFDLRELVAQAVETYAPLADEQGLEVALAAGGPVQVTGDRMRLAQAIADVLTHAYDAAGAGGRVDVAVSAAASSGAPGDVEVSVRGVRADAPMDPASSHAGSLWRNPVEPPARGLPEGSGLGLRLADAIATAHGGRLAVGPGPLATTLVLPQSGAAGAVPS